MRMIMLMMMMMLMLMVTLTTDDVINEGDITTADDDADNFDGAFAFC